MNSTPQQPYQDPNKSTKDKRFPFDKGKKNMKDHIVDPESELVYEEKHWQELDELNPKYVDQMKKGKSPLTKMEEEGVCDGVLHLTGNAVVEHKQDILNTIKNSAELAEQRDPMNKVENIEHPSEDSITVYTVKNQLAVIIGKKIDQSLKGGKLDIKWSKDDQPVEVRWHKD